MDNTEQRLTPVFIMGKETNLRPLAKTDIPNLTRWINDPNVWEFLLTCFPHTEKQEEDWFNKIGIDRDIPLGIETKDGKLIGVMGINKINWVHRYATTGAFIGEKEYWGKGYGTDAKMHLLEYAFHTLNLHKMCSSVYAFNERSVRYSLHCGYRIEGTKKQHIFRKGQYWDLIELGLLYEDWKPIWDKFNQKTGGGDGL